MQRSLIDKIPTQVMIQVSSLVVVLTFVTVPAAFAGNINWDELNLTPQQSSQIERLESEWERDRAIVTDQIARDKAELKSLLPNGDRERIKFLQRRITHNEMYLMNASMETFLDKRDILQPDQRSKLQRMMPGVIRPASNAAPAGSGR